MNAPRPANKKKGSGYVPFLSPTIGPVALCVVELVIVTKTPSDALRKAFDEPPFAAQHGVD